MATKGGGVKRDDVAALLGGGNNPKAADKLRANIIGNLKGKRALGIDQGEEVNCDSSHPC